MPVHIIRNTDEKRNLYIGYLILSDIIARLHLVVNRPFKKYPRKNLAVSLHLHRVNP